MHFDYFDDLLDYFDYVFDYFDYMFDYVDSRSIMLICVLIILMYSLISFDLSFDLFVALFQNNQILENWLSMASQYIELKAETLTKKTIQPEANEELHAACPHSDDHLYDKLFFDHLSLVAVASW